jgi:hemerythrin-like metal-binding protein
MVTWSTKYSVGIAQIDAEHQKLIGLVNDLNAAMLQGRANELMGEIFDNLISYTATHFGHEEGLMRLHSYPELAEHKAEHDRLVEKVKLLQEEFHSGSMIISLDLMAFLRNWVVDHICGMDKKYSPHLQAAGMK